MMETEIANIAEIAEVVEVRTQRRKRASVAAQPELKKSKALAATTSSDPVTGRKANSRRQAGRKRKPRKTKPLTKAQHNEVATINTEEVYAYVVDRVPGEYRIFSLTG